MKWLLIISIIGIGTGDYNMQLEYNTKEQCQEALQQINSGMESKQIKEIKCVEIENQ